METRRQDRDILSHQFRGQQGGGTSTHGLKKRRTSVTFEHRGGIYNIHTSYKLYLTVAYTI